MEGKFHGIKVSTTCTPISHLMYADNLVVYCKADLDEDAEVLIYIQYSCTWTRQEANFDKSSIHFSRNTSPDTKTALLTSLRMIECSHKSNYLGLPFYKVIPKG